MKTTPTELVLTCGSWQEAQRIVDRLLGEQLIHSAEFVPAGDKVKLIMLSVEGFFEKIEKEVAKLHSNKKFTLQTMPSAKSLTS